MARFETVAAWLRKRPLYLTPALMAAVLATSIPQFFLGEVYDALTGTLFGLGVPVDISYGREE